MAQARRGRPDAAGSAGGAALRFFGGGVAFSADAGGRSRGAFTAFALRGALGSSAFSARASRFASFSAALRSRASIFAALRASLAAAASAFAAAAASAVATCARIRQSAPRICESNRPTLAL